MEEMYNVENEVMNEEITPVEENFEELVPMEDEVEEPASNGTLGTILILGATAVAGYVVGTKVVPGVKTGVKKAVGGVKNLISKGKDKKSKKESSEENIVEAECKEVEETPDEEKEVVKE